MKLTSLLLSASLLLSTASALTLVPTQNYVVPGADVQSAVALPGKVWALGADNAVMLLDSGLQVQRAWYDLHGTVRRVVASPDGTRLAAMTDNNWMAWELASGRVLGQGRIYSGSLGFDEAGNLLVMYEGALLKNTLGTAPDRFSTLKVGRDWLGFVAAPDGQSAVLYSDMLVNWVNLADGEVLAEAELQEEPDDLAVTFSPDGQAAVILTGSEAMILRQDGDVTEIDGGEEFTLDGTVFFLNDQEFVYAEEGQAQRYNAQTGKVSGPAQEVNLEGAVARGQQGQYLTLGRGVAQFNPQALAERGRVALPSANAWRGALLPGGTVLAGVDDFRNVKTGQAVKVAAAEYLDAYDQQAGTVWSLSDLQVSVYQGGKLRTLATLDEDAEYDQVSISPDGSLAVVSGYYGAALLSAKTGKLLKKVTAEDLDVEDIHLALPTPDGKALLFIPHEGGVMRYDLASGKQTVALQLPDGAEAKTLQLNPSGTLAAEFTDEDYNRALALVKPGNTQPFKTMPLGGAVQNMKFSPDGKLLAVLTNEKTNALRVFDTATGALLTRTGTFNSTTILLAWSENGQQLMVGSGLLGKAGSVTVFNVQR